MAVIHTQVSIYVRISNENRKSKVKLLRHLGFKTAAHFMHGLLLKRYTAWNAKVRHGFHPRKSLYHSCEQPLGMEVGEGRGGGARPIMYSVSFVESRDGF